MFDHPDIDHINLLDMPLDEELFLIDEKWIPDYNDALIRMISGGDYESIKEATLAVALFDVRCSFYANKHKRDALF